MPARGGRHQQGDLTGQQVAGSAPRVPRRVGPTQRPLERKEQPPVQAPVSLLVLSHTDRPLTDDPPVCPPPTAGGSPRCTPAHPVTSGRVEPRVTQTCPDLHGMWRPQAPSPTPGGSPSRPLSPPRCGHRLPGPPPARPSPGSFALVDPRAGLAHGTGATPVILHVLVATLAQDSDETDFGNAFYRTPNLVVPTCDQL